MKKAKKGQKTFMDLHQPSVASIKNVVKSGYLMKEGGSYKSWKSRYFVVDDNSKTIYYFAKPKDKKPLGFIPLWDCKVEPNMERGFQNCFQVSHPDRRTFYLITTSPKELNEWVDVLRKVVRDHAKSRKLRVTTFWEGAFGDEVSVKWPQFCAALKEHVKDSFDRSTEDKVHFVLATLALKSQPKDEVHVGQLHLFTELLGPIATAYRNLGEICLWYHGALTSSDAESKLAGQPEGTFLLRLRRFAADSGLLALSLVGKKGITHTNIYKEPIADVYYTGFNEVVYSTVQDLIRGHSHCVKECESQAARDYFKQFEAQRLAHAEEEAPPSKSAAVAVASDQSLGVKNGTAVADAMSPRVPLEMPQSVVPSYVEREESPPPRVEPAAAQEEEEDPEAVENAAESVLMNRDGGPIIQAVSGVTTFESMHQMAARDVPDVIHSGFLMRELDEEEYDEAQGIEVERCFFVLSGQLKTLYYFTTPEDTVSRGFVPLWGCDICETPDAPAEGCFEISHPDRQSFFLQAADESEMNDWANALLTVIDEWKVEQARKRERFWREHFGARKEVSWNTFMESLKLEVGDMTERQELQLRFMIGTFAAKNQSPDTIKSRQLYLFVELFGSLSVCHTQMDRVSLWYQGSLTSSDAQSRLKGQRDGTFLIRLRRFAADSGLVAMSFVEQGEPQHVNVFRDPLSECYYLAGNEPVYSSLEELIKGHPDLHPLPEPGLGRAFREYLEKNGLQLEEPLVKPDYVEFDSIEDDQRTAEDEAAALREEKRRIEAEEEERLRAEQEEQQRQERLELERQRQEEEEAERRRAQAEAEEMERIRQEAEERRQRELQEEQARQREEEARAEAERRRREEEEEEERRRIEAEEQRRQQEEEEERRRMEAEEQRRQQEEEEERRRIEAEEQRRRQEEEEEQRRRAAEEKERHRRQEEEVRLARLAAEAEARRRQEEQEAAERRRRQQEEAEAERRRAEEQRRLEREAEERRLRAQEEERRRREQEAAEEAHRREIERRKEEERRLAEQQRLAEQEKAALRAQQQQQQQAPPAKTEQQLRVERQKALIEEERRKLEAERQAKLARLAQRESAGRPTAGAPPPRTRPQQQQQQQQRAPANQRRRSGVIANVQRAEPELEDPVDYSTRAANSAYPEFAKETKVERLYKERMRQARQDGDAGGPPSKGPPAQQQRASSVIKVDVEKVKEILQYLSELEESEALTEDEVYELERMVTVQKDQLVLSYYMTFRDNRNMFVKRCRRHLNNQKK